MVVYEVNINIKKDIYYKYMAWLEQHLKDMLKIDGFLTAKIYNNSDYIDEDKLYQKQVIVQYEVESVTKLNNYFTNQAPKMRSQTQELFGDCIRITRRVLELYKSFSKNSELID